jgi:hypothetical protein
MRANDIRQLQVLMRSKDWVSVYAMLDEARKKSFTQEDKKDETYWRAAALKGEQRYEEALELLYKNANLFNCQSLLHHELARILVKIGHDQDAIDELKRTPIEEEMEDFYGLAIDAKFFYFYLLAKSGDPSVKDRLSEIPDGYRYIAMGGTFLTKPDIISLLK